MKYYKLQEKLFIQEDIKNSFNVRKSDTVFLWKKFYYE